MKYQEPVSPQSLYRKREHPVYEWGESLTSQEFKDECNTEKILERYSLAGLPLPSAAVEHVYRDCTDMRNLQEHLNNARALVQQAEEGFMMLDAKIRKRFDNDVAKMAAWLEDPENIEESYALGLREKRPVGEKGAGDAPQKTAEKAGSTTAT